MFILGIVLYKSVLKSNITFISILSIQAIDDPLGKFNQSVVIIYEILSMLTTFFIIGYIWYMWIQEERYKNLLDEKTITDADYTVMLYNLPIDISKPQLLEIIKRAGIEESNIVYTNKWFEFDKILKLKKKQYDWLYKKKHLEVYRNKKRKMGDADYKTKYPKASILTCPPFKK